MKIKLTQNLIIKSFFTGGIIFFVMLLLRLVLIFLPPVIINAKFFESGNQSTTSLYEQHSNNDNSSIYTVVLYGVVFGTQSHRSYVFVDSKKIPEQNIITWKHNKIEFRIDDVNKKSAMVHVQTREQVSNHIPVIFVERGGDFPSTVSVIDENTEYVEKNNTLEIINTIIEEPYAPIIFTRTQDDMCNSWSIFFDNEEHVIPRRILQLDNKNIRVFFDDSLWFRKNDNIVLQVLCPTTSYKYDIKMNMTKDSRVSFVNSYYITLQYNDNAKSSSNAYLVPIQSKYQHIQIIDPLLSYDYNDNAFIFLADSVYDLTVKFFNREMMYWLGEESTVPIIYGNEIYFRYLFEYALSKEQKNFLTNKYHTIATETLFLSQNTQDILATNLKYNFALYNPEQIVYPIAEDVEFEEINRELTLFIDRVMSFVYTMQAADLQEMNFLLEYDLTKIGQHTIVAQNLLAAQILRNQGIIARTVVGEHIDTTTDTQSKKESLVNTPTTWLEILVKQHGWVSVNQKKYNTIALYVVERVLTLDKNRQNPLVPRILNIQKTK